MDPFSLNKRKKKQRDSMMVGIFTVWDLEMFDKPENVFRRRLLRNPTYPFVETNPNVYFVTVPPAGVALSVVICFAIFVLTVILYSDGEITEYIVFPIVSFLGFLSNVCVSWQRRTIVLDSNSCRYEFYRGDNLIYHGHYHNIYIRLKGHDSGGGDTYYSVVLDGFEVDEIPITAESTQHDRLAKMARKLATRLDLNFFDYTDRSRHHMITHRCPYTAGRGHLVDEKNFRHSVVLATGPFKLIAEPTKEDGLGLGFMV